MKLIYFSLLMLLLFSARVQAEELICTGNFQKNNSVTIEQVAALKTESELQTIFKKGYEYVSPKNVSCSLQHTTGTNVIYSLTWEQGTIQLVAYDPMLTFINLSLINPPSEIIDKNRTIEIYTKAISMPAYDLLASITLSQQQNLGQYFSVRYSHISKQPEQQELVLVWNSMNSASSASLRNILKIKYMHPMYEYVK